VFQFFTATAFSADGQTPQQTVTIKGLLTTK